MDEITGTTMETGVDIEVAGRHPRVDRRADGAVTILVVDDEPDLELLIRQRYRRAIREGRYEFLFAGDGLEALDRLSEHPSVDLVLSDINMPRMDGLRLLGKIADLNRLLKVVIVSAYGDMSNIRTAMNGGAFDFVTKPIDFADLEATIDKARRELDLVRGAFASRKQLTALQRELEIASRIQLSSLPSSFPAFPDRDEFDLFATMIPAREVGGDFYDFFLIDEDHLGISLGDVSGKGVGAAFFMAVTQTMVRATALQGLEPGACIAHVNRVLHPISAKHMFVTMVYAVLNVRSGLLEYVVAGHHAPLMVRDGSVHELERSGGIGLCLLPEFAFETRTTQLTTDDALVLYTDGVNEAMDEDGEQFSHDRVNSCLSRCSGDTAAEQVRNLLREVERFTGGGMQDDDITILALSYKA